MFRYYLDLALRSLKRNPALTGLMIAAIAFGISACMTTLTVFRAMSADYLPAAMDSLIWLTARDTLASVNSLPRARVALV